MIIYICNVREPEKIRGSQNYPALPFLCRKETCQEGNYVRCCLAGAEKEAIRGILL